VVGSGDDGPKTRAARGSATAVGEWIAHQGFDLLTGGGQGIMAIVARAFAHVSDRRGLSIGVIPGIRDARSGRVTAKERYPNDWVEIPIFTHLTGLDPMDALDTRNHINALSGTVMVALPGGTGTHAEVSFALRYGRPVIAFGDQDQWEPRLPAEVRHSKELRDVTEFILAWLGR
jgi:uncharacterized protein (TIGR00725 family)